MGLNVEILKKDSHSPCRGDRDEREKKPRRRKKEKKCPAEGETGEGDEAMEEEGDKEGEEDSEEDEYSSDEDVEENVKKLKVDDEHDEAKESQTQSLESQDTPLSSEESASASQKAESQTVVDDGIFTVTMGPQDGAASSDPGAARTATSVFRGDIFVPRPRMNTLMAVHHGILYLYGGIYEDGDRQVTLSDLYTLDLHKLDKWSTLIACDEKSQVKGSRGVLKI